MDTKTELKTSESLEARDNRWMAELLRGEMPDNVLKDIYFMRALLIKAAKTGYFEVVKYIIEKKYCEPLGEYALQKAIENGHIDVANYIIQHHDKTGLEDPFVSAIKNSQFLVVQTLLKHMTPNKRLMAGGAITAFKRRDFDISLLLMLTPEVQEYVRDNLKQDLHVLKVTSKEKQHNDNLMQMTAFKKDCEMALKLSTNNYIRNSCYFFNAIPPEILLPEVRRHVINIGLANFAELTKNREIPEEQLKNILSINESVLADIDEPITEEKTISLK